MPRKTNRREDEERRQRNAAQHKQTAAKQIRQKQKQTQTQTRQTVSKPQKTQPITQNRQSQNRTQTSQRSYDFSNSANGNRARQSSERSRTQQQTTDSWRNRTRQQTVTRSSSADRQNVPPPSGRGGTPGHTEPRTSTAKRVLANTGRAAGKGVQDSLTGFQKTMYDVGEMASQDERSIKTQAMRQGVKLNDQKKMSELEAKHQQAAETAKQNRVRLQEEQDKRQEEFDKRTKNAKGLEKALYGAAESGAGMLTDLAIGAATGTGELGALASMGARTYGQTRGQAEKEGATENEDRLNALLQAGKEVATERIFAGIGLAKGYASKSSLSLADRVANKMTNKLTGKAANIAHAGVKLAGGVAEENIEELAGWGLDPVISEAAYQGRVRNRRQGEVKAQLKEESDALRSQVTDEATARSIATYLSSDKFIEENKQEYMSSGLSEKQAQTMAEQMRDYLTASLTGDTEEMERLEQEMATTIAGKGLSKESWDFGELAETLAATTLLTGATGLPGSVSSTVQGNKIKNDLGENGIKALANTAIDFEDPEMSEKAQVMADRIASGKEITATQAYELQQGMAQQIQKDQERVSASYDAAAKEMKSKELVSPYEITEDGSMALGEVTGKKVMADEKTAKTAIQAVNRENKDDARYHLSASEVQAGANAIAAFQSGIMTEEDANAFNYTNQVVRTAFTETTGIDLEQYIVKKKNGDVDIPATNAATKDALFVLNTENQIASAEAETVNWMDVTRGEVVTNVTERMGASGTDALQQVLDKVDERDRSQYMLVSGASDLLYQSARNIGTEWDLVSEEFTGMFPEIDPSDLRSMYEAGLTDRMLAEDEVRNRTIEAGKPISEMGEQETSTGNLFVDTKEPPKGTVVQVFTELAKNLGADIHLVDHIKTSGGREANGAYSAKSNTFWINVNNAPEKNVGYIFMHECTHYLKAYAPEQYHKLENLVREKWFNRSPEQMQSAIAEKISLYKGDQKLTEEEALEEIIADAAHEFLTDPNFASQIAEDDPTLAKAIIDSIKNILRKLRAIFAGGNVKDETYMNSLFSELDIMTEAEALWLDAYKAAVKNRANLAIDQMAERSYSISEAANEEFVTLSPERINSLISEYAIPRNKTSDYSKAWIATINPRDFLKLTVRDKVLDTWEVGTKNAWGQEVRDLDKEDLKNTRLMPFLKIDTSESHRVIGHEGRHRMLALYRAGYTEVPVVIQDINEATKNNKQPMEEYEGADLWSQDFGNGPVNDDISVEVYDTIPINEKNRAEIERIYGSTSEDQIKFSISDSEDLDIDQLDQTDSVVEDDNGDPVAEFQDDGSVRFSISSFETKGRKVYQKYLKKMVKTGELSQKEADDMMRELETIYKVSKEFADTGKFAPFTAWSYADVVYDEKGKPVFSAIKKNSEYKMNIDFSTICKKRRTLDAVFREMINRGMFEKLDLNKDESAAMVVNINNLIRQHKFEAACALCFVEARRYRQQQTAKAFTDMWNGLVESMYSDKSRIAYFNFGEDSTVQDVPDGIHTMQNGDLDLSYIKEIANTKNEEGKPAQTAEAKAARLILKDPSQRKLMRVGDMMASTGFENMQIHNPKLMKIYNSKKGTGGAKSSFGDVQYLNEIISSKTFNRRSAYAVSGVRIQSFSDYVPRMVFDYVQVIADLAAKKLPAHAYTKEVLFARQFGLTGAKINLSLVPDVVADSEIPGLNKDGNYVWNEEGTFPYDEAMKLQQAEGYKENCGTIAVGISDQQILKMLADPTIQMVIPYHKSSLNPIVAAMTNVDRFQDYTDFQNTKDAEGKTVKKDFEWDNKLFDLTHDKNGKQLPKEQWGNVQDLVKEYAEWCKERNYTPKFSQFLYMEDGSINPGYYKLLEDFALLDNDGNFKPQGDVQMRFPTESDAFGSMKSLIEQGLSEDTELEEKRAEEVSDIVDEIDEMFNEGTLTEQSAASEKLSSRLSISTDDPDIRFSFPTEDEVNAYITEITEDIDDISLDDEVAEEGRIRIAKSKQEFIESRHLLWNEKWLTEGKVLKESSVQGKIRQLVMGVMENSDTDRKYKQDLVDKLVTDAKEAYWKMKDGKEDEAADLLWDSALSMIENADFIDDTMFKQYKDLRDYLRNTTLQIGEEYQDDGNYRDFRKRNKGRIKLKTGNTNIDSVYTEMQQLWPEWFNEDEQTTVPDQLLHIEEVLDEIQPYRYAYTSEEAASLAMTVANDLYDIIYSGEEYSSVADIYKRKYDEKTKALKARHEEAIRQIKEKEKAKTDRERERTEKQKERAEAWKRKYNERVQKDIQDRKERAERQDHRKKFDRILGNYKTLCTWALNPTKEKNVPEVFLKTIADFLQTLDLQTERSKELEAKYGPAKKTLQMRELKDKLKALSESKMDGDFYVPGGFELDAYAAYLLDKLSDEYDGKPVDLLDNVAIGELDVLLKTIIKNIKRYRQVKTMQRMVDLYEIGGRSVGYFRDKVKRDGVYGRHEGLLGALETINATSLTPAYLFDRMGPLKEMYDVLRYDGFDKYIKNEKMIIDRLNEILGKFNNTNKKGQNMPGSEIEKWRDDREAITVELSNGESVTMSVAQVMSLYCLAKRGVQAFGHMMKGGIVVTPIQTGSKIEAAKEKLGLKKVYDTSEKHVLSYEDILNIISKLSEDQKHVADELQKLMSVDMAKLGNEAHVELYGYEMFKEDNYFPIKVHGNERATDINNIGDVIEKIKSFGFTKPLTPKAAQAIEIDDIFSIVADHCNGMNLYNAYLIPITDFMKVLNYNGDSLTMKEAIAQAYGNDMLKYILNLMKDINGIKGENRGGLEGLMNRALGRAKRTAVFGNIRVALQQPTAIVRAWAEISPKYFRSVSAGQTIKGLIPETATEAMEEMWKYCPIAQWKAWGYYDTYMGRDIEDVMMNSWSIGDKLLAGYYGQLDNSTWAMIWQAVKAEQAEKHPDMDHKSKEFLQICGRRASEVFDKTQVVDSTFHRSDAMRSKQVAVKIFTAFMAEPTLTLNVFRAGLWNASEEMKAGNKAAAANIIRKTVSVIVAQALLVSAAQAFADAWRGKDPGLPWDDDDDDDEKKAGYWERWLHNFMYNVFDQLHLENNMYLVKDVSPYINYMISQGADYWNWNPTLRAVMGWDQDYLYSQNNLVFAGLENTANGVAQLFKKLAKGDDYKDFKTKEPKKWYDIIQKITSGVGTFTGIPAGTLMRDLKPIIEMILPAVYADETKLLENVTGSKSDDNGSKNKDSGNDAETEAKIKEYEDSLGDKYTEDQKKKLVRQYKKTINAEAKPEGSDEEDLDYKMEMLSMKAAQKATEYSGSDLDDALWDVVGDGYSKKLEEYDFEYIANIRAIYKANGGDPKKFDAHIVKGCKSAYKRTFTDKMTDQDIYNQNRMRVYMLDHGVSAEEISDMCYHTDAAKDLKAALRINNEKLIMKELVPLVRAGLSRSDWERLVKYKNYGAKTYDGKYNSPEYKKSTGTYVWPTQGQITSGFGYRRSPTAGASSNHPAIDIGAAQGSPVVAADGGTIIKAGNAGGYGNQVAIRHENGTVTYYSHLYSWNVKPGDTVAQGQQIGQVGSTGISTGPHLDFKVEVNGEPVNPLDYLS